jgi:hypothetical protein
MKRYLLIFLLAIFFPVTSVAQSSSKPKPTNRSAVSNAQEFQFLSINGRAVAAATKPCNLSLIECGNERIGLYGYSGFGGPDSNNPRTETFVFKRKNQTLGIYLLTMRVNEDDSVAGERVRLSFIRKGNRWHFVEARRQFQCARGQNTIDWTKKLCP